MKSLIPLVILCNLLASGLSRASIEVSWFANAGVANVDSGGSLLTSDYTFELGAFTGSFVLLKPISIIGQQTGRDWDAQPITSR